MLLTDFRYAVRSLRKAPLASVTIVVCLGFSIGAVGTVFTWMEAAVFRPLPGIHDLARLSSLKMTGVGGDDNLSYPDFKELREAETRAPSRTFVDLAAFNIRRINLLLDPTSDVRLAEPLWGVLTSASYFDVLQVRPVIGRVFAPGDDAVVGGSAVVVISYALWERRFAKAADILGRHVWLNGRDMTIIGVAPQGFSGTIARLGMDLWMPLTMHGEVGGFAGIFEERGVRWISVFGRLAPGVSLTTSHSAMEVSGRRLAATYPEDRNLGLTTRALDIGPVDRIAPLFVVLQGLSVLVVLVVCSNIANLLLQRGAAREHEMGVRLALGARPARIVRQLMTESLLLGLGGVLVGGAVLLWARNALNSLVPASPLPIITDMAVDRTVVIVLTIVGVSTVFVFGLAPALRSARVDVRASLSGGGTRGGSAGSGRLRGLLVSAQFALSLAVLITAGLFLQRLGQLHRVDRGFRDPEQVLVATVDFIGVREPEARQAFVERVVERLRVIPGVRSAAAASFVPLGFLGYSSLDVAIDGYVPQPGESMSFLLNRVSDDYFTTMGIPIVRGRAIDARDRAGSQPVAVVNEAFAHRFWGTQDPIGRAIRVDGTKPTTVVGVVKDGKYFFLAPLDAPSPPFVYLPFSQAAYFSVVLHARAAGDPLALMPSVQRAVTAVDSRLNAISPSTLESYSSAPFLVIQVGSAVLGLLGAVALMLATVGLYAVTAYAVTQQRREIGIRMALGATPARVVSGFLGHAARYVAFGATLGLVLAGGIARTLASSLPGSLSPAANWTSSFAFASLALAIVAAVAALIPSARAARMNPTEALRNE